MSAMLKKTSCSSNGGGASSSSSSSLLLSSRSLSSPVSLFSMDAAAASVLEQPKNPPDGSSVSSNARSRGAVTGLAAVLVAAEAERAHRGNGRVQLPSTNGGDLPSSPIEFGVKNRDSQLALLSPVQRSPLSSAARNEAELDEDYTCVIDRRPNPKMIHIFDHRVVDSSGAAADEDSSSCSTETTKHSAATNAATGTCFTIKGSVVHCHRTRR